jgi:hypothetical protein
LVRDDYADVGLPLAFRVAREADTHIFVPRFKGVDP